MEARRRIQHVTRQRAPGMKSSAVGIPVTTIVAMKMKKGIMPIFPLCQPRMSLSRRGSFS